MDIIDIYRGPDLFVQIKPDESSSQVKQVMGDNSISLDFRINHYIKFSIGDYCTVFDTVYTLHEMPVVTKVSTYEYSYKGMTLRSEAADLLKVQYLFLDPVNSLSQSDFSLMGNLKTFADLLLQNLNRVVSGFSLGQVIDTDYKNLSFSQDSCSSALAKLASEFKTEWWVEGKLIHLTARSRDTGITFKHGRNNGLYEITRQNLNNTGILTRLYAFGSDKNLPPNYYSTRLCLPGGYVPCLISVLTCIVVNNGDGTSNFQFAWTAPAAVDVTGIDIIYKRTVFGIINTVHAPVGGPYTLTLPTGEYEFRFKTIGGSCGGISTYNIILSASTTTPLFVNSPIPYVEQNKDLYGIIEDTQFFEDIYPSRIGTITAVDAADPFSFIDNTIDFDVNAQLLPGMPAKVTFNTGQLSGFTFDISSFDNAIKKVRIFKNKIDTKLNVPTNLIRPGIGDKYVFIDINMPQTYVTAAENLLLKKAQDTLTIYSQPQVSYAIVLDPKFVRFNNLKLDVGDTVFIKDDQLEIDKKIRIIQLTRNIVNEDNYQVQLSDVVTQGTIQQIINISQQNSSGLNDLSAEVKNNVLLNGTVVGDLRFEKGTAILPDMPGQADMTGFSQVYIENTTGKLYKKT